MLTDSGGIQEETTFLGVPCFTLRDNTERPITVAQGTNTLLGLEPRRIRDILPALERPPQPLTRRRAGTARRPSGRGHDRAPLRRSAERESTGRGERLSIAIYRAPMRARDMDVPAGAGAEYGLERVVVGIAAGRRRTIRPQTPSLRGSYPRERSCGRATGRVAYRLGRITGDVRDDDSAPAQAVGIRHVRPTRWLQRAFDGRRGAAGGRANVRAWRSQLPAHPRRRGRTRRTEQIWRR